MKKWFQILEKIDDYRWKLPRSYKKGMLVDGIIFADHQLMDIIDQENAVEQVANVAFLPGILGASLAMPDIHWGYGFPVGGVAALDYKKGVISPGGIGFDINCGVRLLKTYLTEKDLKGKLEKLLFTIFSNIPCGVGKGSSFNLSSHKELSKVLLNGAKWAVDKGFGWSEDIIYTESNGKMEPADPESVSSQAKERGKDQLGTLGSGNHFLEIQVVKEIFDPDAASVFGIEKSMVTVMIHSGSRGLGHQIATDYLKTMEKSQRAYGITLPDRQLACAPINSPEGKSYLNAMACAANYAWANRQIMAHLVRESFEKVFCKSADKLGMQQLYDVAHNIAKIENHIIEGKKHKVCVHRKGAVRSFAAGSPHIPEKHRPAGQVVIIPGDMGRYSYILKGSPESALISFSSACHGAGRVLSRGEAVKRMKGRDIAAELKQKGILVLSASSKGLKEEAPEAYKNIADVVNTAHNAGLAYRTAKLKPLGIMKG